MRGEVFEPGQVGFDDLFINLLREHQGNVDAEAFAGELLDGRQSGLCRRHLDHHIVPADRAPQTPRLLDRRVGVYREIGRHLQADITIPAVRLVVDGTQRVGRVLDVLDRQLLVERHDVVVVFALKLLQGRIVIFAAGNGLFEDRRIGRDAGQPILFNELLEPALGDKTSGEKVEPDNLPEVIQLA